jgi:hypothetical protein
MPLAIRFSGLDWRNIPIALIIRTDSWEMDRKESEFECQRQLTATML